MDVLVLSLPSPPLPPPLPSRFSTVTMRKRKLMQLPHGLQPTSLSFSLQDKRKTWLNMTCCSLLFLSRCSREKGPRKAGLGPLSGGLRRPPALSLRLQVTLEPRPCGCGNDRPRMREKAPSPRASVTAQGRGLLALAKGFRGHIASGHSGPKISLGPSGTTKSLFFILCRALLRLDSFPI